MPTLIRCTLPITVHELYGAHAHRAARRSWRITQTMKRVFIVSLSASRPSDLPALQFSEQFFGHSIPSMQATLASYATHRDLLLHAARLQRPGRDACIPVHNL